MLSGASVFAALTAAVSLWFVLYGAALARRSTIGARSLGAFAVALGANFLLTAVVVAVLGGYGVTSAAGLGSLAIPEHVATALIATTPLSGLLMAAAVFGWLWFVLTYTVRMDPGERLGVYAVAGGVFLVATLNGVVGALNAFGYVASSPLLRVQVPVFLTLVEILGTGVAIGAGVAQLYRASRSHGTFSRRAALALSVPVLLPYLTRYLYQFGLVTDFGTIGALRVASLSVGFVGLWAAVERYGVFAGLPASRTVGRETAFETAEAAIAVLNDDGRIADLNPAAEDLFDADVAAAVGEPATEVLPAPTVDAPAGTTYEFPNGDCIVEVRTTHTTDDRGRAIGQTIVCTDITDERRRQQRIEVLNRVLRHNLRNDANAASGYVGMAAEGGEDAERYAAVARSKLDDLVEIGAKAREIEDMLASDPFGDPTPLGEVVENAVGDAREDHDGSVSVSVSAGVTTTVNPRLLRPVVAELVGNALKHATSDGSGDGPVEVRYEADANALVVADSGPGIPEHEIEVFEEGETPLKHGSGLGLWLVKWGVSRFGGEVRFDVSESGTQVAVCLPT